MKVNRHKYKIALKGMSATRFWLRVSSEDESGCMHWVGATSSGYGVIKVRGVQLYAHRVAWLLERGCIPGDLRVCHRCDMPTCCNVSHMFLGTLLDNNRDRDRKGRGADFRGSNHPSVRITHHDVVSILRAHDMGETQRSIAKAYGLSYQHVSNIIKGIRWSHLEART